MLDIFISSDLNMTKLVVVQPKMEILLSLTHPQVIQTCPTFFFFFWRMKEDILKNVGDSW